MQFGNQVSAKEVGSMITKHHFCSPQRSRTSRRNYGNISGLVGAVAVLPEQL